MSDASLADAGGLNGSRATAALRTLQALLLGACFGVSLPALAQTGAAEAPSPTPSSATTEAPGVPEPPPATAEAPGAAEPPPATAEAPGAAEPPPATPEAPAPAAVLADAEAHLQAGRIALLLEAFAASPPAPTDARALAQRAAALAAADRHAEAIAAFDAALAAGHALPRTLQVARAGSARMLGDLTAARAGWREVLQAHGEDADAGALPAAEIAAAARAARELGRGDPALFRVALSRYEEAIARDPAYLPARVALGELLLEKYNSGEASEAFGEVLQGSSAPHLPALMGLARTQHFDHSRAAEQTVAAVLEVDGEYLPALRLAARLHLETEEYDAAQDLLEQALALNPGDRGALALRGALAFLRGDAEALERDLVGLRERAPGDAEVYVTLAEIAAQNRRYADAVKLAGAAVGVDAQAWRAHVLLGINRMREGDIDGGRRALETAFRGDPFNVWSRNTLELLDKLADFSSIRSQHFVLVAPRDEAPVLAPYLLPLAEQAYAHFVARHDHRPRTPIRIELYPTHEDFSVRTAGLVGLDILGVSFGPVIALDSPSAGAFGPTNWGSVIWHELAHSFHLSKSRHRAPRWFSEGLAVYEERRARPGWGASVSPGFLRAYRDGKLPRPSDLNRVFLRPSYPEQMLHGYFLGAVLMEYLEAEHGFAAIDAMLTGFAEGATLEALSETLLGMPISALDERFDAYLRARFGAALAALEPPAEGAEPPYVEALRAGTEALEAERHDEAETALLRAQALLPDHAGEGSPYHLLADLYIATGHPWRAVYWLRQGIDLDADDVVGHRRLAALLDELGAQHHAGEVIERLLHVTPFDARLHTRLAELHEAATRWPAAVQAREAVLTLGGADPVAAGQLLARALLEAGEVERARSTLLRVLEQAPLYEEGLELLLELRSRSARG